MQYLLHTAEQRREMLERIGAATTQELFNLIPQNIRLQRPLQIPDGLPEQELVRHIRELAAQNANVDDYLSFVGAGAYEHYVPGIVQELLQRSEFYTAYTPYQPEISQGTLTAIYEFQTMVCELMGMDVANASMYDGASALAEAALMACEITGRSQIIVSQAIHPEYREVVRTYLYGRGIELLEIPYANGVSDLLTLEKLISSKTAAILMQNPNFFGNIEIGEKPAEIAHAAGALLVMAVNPVSLGLLKAPGDYGADIAVGEGQPFGSPVSFGGPFLGLFACKNKYIRRMPGRVVGATTDKNGKQAFVLTLQAREQHIRRDKATSNICSNEALCALAFTIHLSLLGKHGISRLARLNLEKAHYAAERIAGLNGYCLAFPAQYFNEFVVKTEVEPAKINAALRQDQIIGGLDLGRFFPELDHHLLFCVTETKRRQDIDRLVERLEGIK
ncbi:MAG TPA: aminomethyl-transferring glycine dehydrogenase subunit GcvPA [Desulfobacteria bacterium]|nr:aminomethyl-transferring glycine dehydrogenase subunit GcvPA [Desulfobacteria bacterium]